MLFKKKSKDKSIQCKNCSTSIQKDFVFCPYCAAPQKSQEEEMRKYGLLGRNDASPVALEPNNTMLDKMVSSIFNTLMKSIDKQLKEELSLAQPGAATISIKVGNERKRTNSMPKRKITEEQLTKISKMKRMPAKTNVRRLADKIIYELETPGVDSSENVFISKLESGYEVKALSESNMYVNSLPIDLPLKSLTIANGKLLIEFNSKIEQQ